MGALPRRFVGVWDRVALTVKGEAIPGAGRSWWFQASSQFVDVRGAGGGLQSEAFAGVTSWDPATETLTWQHDLDMHPGDRDDSGRVEWDGADLIEFGTAEQFGDTIEYSELWRPVATPGDVVTTARRGGGPGALAWCGRLGVVTIDDRPDGPFRGGLFVDRGWALTFDVVHGPPLPIERGRLADAPVGATFQRWAESWTVTDVGTVPEPG